jgi:hypothetical protein
MAYLCCLGDRGRVGTFLSADPFLATVGLVWIGIALLQQEQPQPATQEMVAASQLVAYPRNGFNSQDTAFEEM